MSYFPDDILGHGAKGAVALVHILHLPVAACTTHRPSSNTAFLYSLEISRIFYSRLAEFRILISLQLKTYFNILMKINL